MNHLILAETQFFAMINGKDNGSTETAYGGFVQEVINLCYGGNDAKHIIVALAFAEIELQHHPQNLSVSEENVVTVYIRKALSFIRKMQKIVSASAITSVPPLTSTSETKATVPALQWTGNAVELVELIYALYATGCINGGKASLKELAPVLYSFFGVESKDCYRFYTDIKRRKSDSRTYFLEKMQDKLNAKMRHDDELERMKEINECQTKDKRPDYTVSYPSSFTITLLSAGKPIKIINFASINQ